MPTSSVYRLDERHLEHVLETLKREREKYQLSRSSFLLLRFVVFAFAILWLVHWLLVVGTPLERVLNRAANSLALASWFWVTVVASVALGFLGAILVFLNLPMVQVIRRQVKLARQLDSLLLVDRPPARFTVTPARGFWLMVLAGLLLSAVALSFYFVFAGIHGLWRLLAVLVLFGGGAYLILTRRKIPLRALRIAFWGLLVMLALAVILTVIPQDLTAAYAKLLGRLQVVVMMLTVPALVFVGDRALARVGEQLELTEDADSLHRSLEKQKSDDPKSGFFVLASADAERLARIERRAIRHSRQAAIASSRGERAASFTIFKSPMARARIDELERRDRFRVESRIQELALEPRPEEATAGDQGRCVLAIPECGLEVEYEIDEGSREVAIRIIRPAGGEETS